LAIVGNQIDYVMKPWTEERIEVNEQTNNIRDRPLPPVAA